MSLVYRTARICNSLVTALATALMAAFEILAGPLGAAQAQVPGAYTTSWIGNTYGTGGPSTSTGQYWMQDYIAQMTVQPDGTCWTTSPWDEGGRSHGEYKNGLVVGNQDNRINNQSIAVGGQTWTISGSSVTSSDGRSINIAAPAALGSTSDGKLLIADNGPNKQVYIYSVSGSPSLAETIGARGGIGASYTASYVLPAATNAPAYAAGTYGPGVYHPLKFWNLTGVGEDSTGRLFVSRSNTGGGSAILCFKRDGNSNWILDWRIESYCFVDSVDFDPTSDGQDVYGVQEHYKLDYTQTTPGSEWSIFAFTADNQAFPNDPRNIDSIHAGQEHGLTSCWYRSVGGHRLLFVEGMTTQMLNIFRFENGSERAVPAGLVMQNDHTIYRVSNGLFWPPNRPSSNGSTLSWLDANGDGDYQSGEYGKTNYAYSYGQWVDSGGGLWWAANPIIVSKLSSFDSAGNPVYNNASVQSYAVTGVPAVGQVQYQEAQNRLVICDKSSRDLTGGTLYKIDNWSGGHRAASTVCALSSTHPVAFSAAGSYAFEVGFDSRGKVWVHSLLDGSLVGTMDVPDLLGGNSYSGNVDIGYGVHAFQRANGEYEVAVEDDGWAKVLLYRWNPNRSVGNQPAAPTGLAASAGNTQVSLTWAAASGATSYSVYRGTSAGGEGATAIKTGLTSTSFTDTGLTNGTTHYYKVKVVNSSGTSSFSGEASAKPAAATSVSHEAEAAANTIGSGSFVDTNASASGGKVVRYLGGSGTDVLRAVRSGSSRINTAYFHGCF